MSKEKVEWKIIQRAKKGTVIKTISLDEDIAEFLSKQPNVSDYIRALVKHDMNLPTATTWEFEPGEPLFRIYQEAKRFWQRKRGLDIIYAEFGGFPQQIQPEWLEEMFDYVEGQLEYAVEHTDPNLTWNGVSVVSQCEKAIKIIRSAREKNELETIYKKLYAHWLRQKDDE